MKSTEDTKSTEEMKKRSNDLSREIIGAAIEVHTALGPGLLESAYEDCVVHELELRGFSCRRQVPIPVVYKGHSVRVAYRADIIVEDLVVVELKSSYALIPIDSAKLLTYLRLSKKWLGLILNFNVMALKHGIRRVVN